MHGLRGIAATSVFISHCIGGYLLHLCSSCNSNGILKTINTVGTFGVEIFFLISGYVMFQASKRTPPMLFLRNRFWRLYPVFLLFTALFFVGNYFLHLEPQKNSIDLLLYNALFLNLLTGTPALTPNAWTITYEVYFYLLVYSIVFPSLNGRKIFIPALAIFLSIIFFWKYPITAYFVAGVLLNIYGERLSKPLNHLPSRIFLLTEICLLLLTLYLAGSEQKYNWQWITHHPSVFIQISALFLLVLFIQHPKSRIGNSLTHSKIMLLGTVSYTLYLAHPYSYIVSRELTKYLGRYLQSEMALFTVFASLTIVSTLILTFLVYRTVERPFYEYFTGKKMIGKI